MKKFYGYFENENYKVGLTGGIVYVYDRYDNELAKFRVPSGTDYGTFKPGTNIFVAKSFSGCLLVFDLDKPDIVIKYTYTRCGSEDKGFAFSPSGDLFYNIECPDSSVRTQFSVYDGNSFQKLGVYYPGDEKIYLEFVETYPDEVYVFGFMRGDSGVFEYPFTAKFEDGELKDIRKITSNAYPITDWTPWDKNDCRYLYLYKQWETTGCSIYATMSYKCLEDSPVRITIKEIHELN